MDLGGVLLELKSLRTLDVSDNRLDEVPRVIPLLGELERLNLSDNRIAAAPVEMPARRRLRRLDPHGNPLTLDQVPAPLRAAVSLSGISSAGSYTFTIQATQASCTVSQSYTVLVNAGFASALSVASDFDSDGNTISSKFETAHLRSRKRRSSCFSGSSISNFQSPMHAV